MQEYGYSVIMHGCNCHSTMGAGVALWVKTTFPEAYEADVDDPREPKDKLRGFTYARSRVDETHDVLVFNLYTQLFYSHRSSKPKLFSMDAFEHSFREAQKKVLELDAEFQEFGTKPKVLIPRIGAGLGGGDWFEIEDSILRLLNPNIKLGVAIPTVVW